MEPDSLDIQEQWDEGAYKLNVKGDLIITNAKGFQQTIDTALEKGAQELTLDLNGVQYIDSFGIGVIVKTKAEIDKKQGDLHVFVNQTLLNMFQKCHLDDYIDIELVENEKME